MLSAPWKESNKKLQTLKAACFQTTGAKYNDSAPAKNSQITTSAYDIAVVLMLSKLCGKMSAYHVPRSCATSSLLNLPQLHLRTRIQYTQTYTCRCVPAGAQILLCRQVPTCLCTNCSHHTKPPGATSGLKDLIRDK